MSKMESHHTKTDKPAFEKGKAYLSYPINILLMNLSLRCVFFCVLMCMNHFSLKAQDVHFSQFFEAPLLRNPALAGLFAGDIRLQSVYRNQWQSVTVPYQTVSLNGEYKLAVGKSEDFLTVGGQILYDKAGTVALTATHILPAINYHKSLSVERNSYLSLGFMGGLVQKTIDRSRITTNSQFDGNNYNGNLANGETFPNNSLLYFDGIAGLSYNTQISDNKEDNLYLGAAFHHFNTSASTTFYSLSKVTLQPKWVFSGGVKWSLDEFSALTVEGDYSQQGPSQEMIGGLMYSRKLDDYDAPKFLLHGGIYTRWKDAIIPVAKLEMKPLAFSVSYDINISKLSAASNGKGGFELSIAYQKYLNNDHSSRDAVRCPSF